MSRFMLALFFALAGVFGFATATSAQDINCDQISGDEADALLAQDPSDPNGLDDDSDGIPCEGNPRSGGGVAAPVPAVTDLDGGSASNEAEPFLQEASSEGLTAEEQAYIEAAASIIDDTTTATNLITEASLNPRLGDQDWIIQAATAVAGFNASYQSALELTPPASLQGIHASFLEGLRLYSEAGNLFAEGVDSFDASLIETAAATLAEGTVYFEEAGRLLGEFDADRDFLPLAVSAADPAAAQTGDLPPLAGHACADFDSFVWAQSVYDADPAGNPDLDPDGDGIACPELAPGFAPALWTTEIPEDAELVDLLRVVDGDTIEVGFADGSVESVRLILIDTPEAVDPNTPDECFGAEATAFATDVLTGYGGDLYLETDVSDRDRFGRMLRYAWLDLGDAWLVQGQPAAPAVYNVNEAIARAGFADISTFPPDVEYADQIGDAVVFARDNQLGLWSFSAAPTRRSPRCSRRPTPRRRRSPRCPLNPPLSRVPRRALDAAEHAV